MAHGFNGNPVITPGIPGPALVKIGAPIVANGAPYVDFLNQFDKNFTNFKIFANDLSVGTNTDDIQAYMYIEGAMPTSNYFSFVNTIDYSVPSTFAGSSSTVKIPFALSVSNTSSVVTDLEIDINNPNGTTRFKSIGFRGKTQAAASSTIKTLSGAGVYNGTNVRFPLIGLRIQASTGTISGIFQLYGYL